MDEEDYESLPNSTLTTHLAAGAIAGMLEHCAMYPIDSVKTKMQTINTAQLSNYRGMLSSIRHVSNQSGLLSTYKGINAVAMGAGPAHALYFACYEKMKENLKPITGYGDTHISVSGISGVCATLIHDGFMNPFDVVKQRLQMVDSPYRGVVDTVRSILAKEGMGAFYRSYTTQLAMNVPFQSIHFLTYENLNVMLNPERKYDPITHMLAGAGAGAIAAAATTPLDVIKTALNTQEMVTNSHPNGRGHYLTGMKDAARSIYQTRGIWGFSGGMQARIVFYIPSTAICWSVYEFFKYTITKNKSLNESAASRTTTTTTTTSSSSTSPPSSSSGSVNGNSKFSSNSDTFVPKVALQ